MLKQYAWVPDGIYDHRKYMVRYEIQEGAVKTIATKMWIDQGGPPGASLEFGKTKWGEFPDMPPKPDKK